MITCGDIDGDELAGEGRSRNMRLVGRAGVDCTTVELVAQVVAVRLSVASLQDGDTQTVVAGELILADTQ